MRSILLALALFAPCLKAESVELSIQDVRYYATIGQDSLLWMWSGDTYLCNTTQLKVNLPAGTVTIEDPVKGEFETTWKDSTGAQHTVRTPYDPTRPHLINQARDHHVQAVRALQSAWPPAQTP